MACVKVELSRQNRKAGATLFAMDKITQTMQYRQSLIRYAEKYGVTKAAIRYRTNRQYIYRWKKRYDGTLQSLADRSHLLFFYIGKGGDSKIAVAACGLVLITHYLAEDFLFLL